jgi:hypothetical protein
MLGLVVGLILSSSLFWSPLCPAVVASIHGVIPCIPIQVRVAGSRVDRVSLQPPCRAWVVLPCADVA